LREACLEALKNSGELVLVVEKLEHYDFSLSIFICLLRRTARLLDKRLAIVGKLGDFVCLYSHGSRCFITGGSSCCQCENLFTQVRVP